MGTILAAVISGAVTLIVCMVNNHAQAQKTRALLDYRLSELEKKVDKHNQVLERTYRLETEMEVAREQIRVANHRIQNLERE